MKKIYRALFLVLISSVVAIPLATSQTLLDARKGVDTVLLKKGSDTSQFKEPPTEIMSIVSYPTALGNMSAYLSKHLQTNQRYPAIIWLTGGFPVGGGSESQWQGNHPRDNDQSAKIYWQEGVITMYPALRGTFGNPGRQEAFYGEVNDVIAAREYLASLDHVDPKRIYLGGHSTGGTLALLVATSVDKFAGVFAFGPVANPVGAYGTDNFFHDTNNPEETRLRAPVNFLDGVSTPTYIIEGEGGNLESLIELKKASENNKNLHFIVVKGADHFDTLFPLNRLLARKISATKTMVFSQAEAQIAYDDIGVSSREVDDINVLAGMRLAGYPLNTSYPVDYYFAAGEESQLKAFIKPVENLGFSVNNIEKQVSSNGDSYYTLSVSLPSLTLLDLEAVFNRSSKARRLAIKNNIYYQGWRVRTD